MVPNKFEKHIKKQLRQREIPPSESAWERLSEDLENTGKFEKKSYYWYGIAASFIGILIISVVYFNSGNSGDIPNVQIVDSPKKTELPKEDSSLDFRDMKEDIEDVVAVDPINKLDSKEKVVLNSSKVDRKKVEAVAINNMEQKISVNHKMKVPKKSLPKGEEILNAKILEVVAQVNSLEKENINLTDAEVDSLLRKAQTEIVVNKAIQNANKVDPMALLTDVEDQLDRSFRDKLFERLKTGFVKVRTAVADNDN